MSLNLFYFTFKEISWRCYLAFILYFFGQLKWTVLIYCVFYVRSEITRPNHTLCKTLFVVVARFQMNTIILVCEIVPIILNVICYLLIHEGVNQDCISNVEQLLLQAWLYIILIFFFRGYFFFWGYWCSLSVNNENHNKYNSDSHIAHTTRCE